jgi:hypothetical protein
MIAHRWSKYGALYVCGYVGIKSDSVLEIAGIDPFDGCDLDCKTV